MPNEINSSRNLGVLPSCKFSKLLPRRTRGTTRTTRSGQTEPLSPKSQQRALNDRIDAACRQIQAEGQPDNLSKYAREKDLPYQRLRARLSGQRSRSAALSESQTRLSIDEERAIARYCHDRDLMQLPVPLFEVKAYADYLLEQKIQPGSSSQLGVGGHGGSWIATGSKKSNKPIELARKEAHDLYTIWQWFKKCEASLQSIKFGPLTFGTLTKQGFVSVSVARNGL